jgi:ribose-phosphate pyrophosphokinase
MEQLIMVDALKRASAKRITVVSPFYPYARQDKKHLGREPISARLIADLYKTAGADRLMSIDLHASQIQGFFDGPVDHLMALPVLETTSRRSTTRPNLTVVSPDAGRVRLADAWTDGSAPRWRSSTSAATRTRPTRWRSHEVVGDVRAGCACWSTT